MLILNEERYAASLYNGKNDQVKSVLGKIGYITRYNFYTLGYNDDDANYKHAVEWMNKNHDNFDESYYSNLVSDAIKRAHKMPFYNIDSIKITKSELDSISSLDNLRAEKVLFVLLCMAKQQRAISGFTNGLVRYSLTELCKLARISVPADDREYILYNILQKGLLSCPKKNDTKCLIVNCVNDNDDIILELDEIDCKELAYVYLNWKNDGKGYTRCQKCNKLIKQSKTRPRKYCEECAKYEPIGEKIVVCVDCGVEFKVDGSNKRTYRCVKCQHKKQLEYQKIAMERLRNQCM